MKYSTLIADMIEEGASAEMILVAVRAVERQEDDAIERGKEKARARWHRWDEKRRSNVGKRLQTPANNSRGGARVEDKTSNSEIEPQTNKQTREREVSAFDTWYRTYPNKVQRGAAERAFPKALELAGSVEALIAGVQRYVASKPADRQWQNPATWLNGKGWLDAPAAVVVPTAREGPSSLNLSKLYATQERMENAQQLEPAETSVRYLSAANG